MAKNQSQVYQREGDPRIYLFAMGQWYYYDPSVAPLGSGAMGTVYLGYSCVGNQRIAVKRVKDNFSNNKAIRERARQEASLSFRHPNLVEMLGICEYPNSIGPIFLLSRFVDGADIDKHVKKQLQDLPDRVEIISREICSVLNALTYLHSRGVVHRDVKPSNIMIENGCNVKLMDLGIARLNGGNQYSSYGFVGTPQYAAPEQILRQDDISVEINATTDIYALGITFYELLTGENPFASEIEAEVLTSQVTKKLPPHKNIPPKLMKVIWKATEKQQQQRYQTAADFKNAIESVFLHQSNVVEDFFEKYKWTLIGISAGVILMFFLLIIM